MRALTQTLLGLLCGVALTGAAACGFQPLYAESTGIAPILASTAVETPDTRTGRLLREELEDEFGRQPGGAPRYRLVVDVDEIRYPRGLRVDDTANRYDLQLGVTYTMVELPSGAPVTSGFRSVVVTYDVADAPYAGVAANLDGQERAASEAARLIRSLVTRALLERQGPAPLARAAVAP